MDKHVELDIFAPLKLFLCVRGRNEFAIFSKNNAEYFIVENRERTG